MALIPLDGDLVASVVPSAGATTPYAAYTTWAAELGVSGTTTLQALSDDDNSWPITLASEPISGGTTVTAGFSSEGALGLYSAPPASTASTSMALTDVSRMYMTATRPDALFTFHPPTDLRTEAVLLQRSGSVTIIRGLLRYYGSSAYTVRFAIRMDRASARFIFEPVDQSFYFRLFKPSSNTSAYSSICVAGGLYEFATILSRPTAAAGFVGTGFGVHELASRLALGASTTVFGVASTPSLATGAAPATVFGLAAQIHPAAGFTGALFGGARLVSSALGFAGTKFGIASLPLAATGAAPATVFGLAAEIHPASGFMGSALGSPRLVPASLGFSGTMFGAGLGRQYSPVATLGRVANFGTSSSPYAQALPAVGGVPATGFGSPFMFRAVAAAEGRTCYASGARMAAAGVPAYSGAAAAQAAGPAPETSFGLGAALARYRCAGFPPATSFGAAAAHLGGAASGAQATLHGTHSVGRGTYAQSAAPRLAWGLARASRAGDYLSRTTYARARFGQPAATLVKGERASGARATEFGSPASARRFRGLHIPPEARFGRPLMTRNPAC